MLKDEVGQKGEELSVREDEALAQSSSEPSVAVTPLEGRSSRRQKVGVR